jgi:hypothetical protein
VPDLITKSALAGRSFTLSTTTLAEAQIGSLTSIAPFPGQTDATSTALGHAFPQPNTTSGPLLWTGRDQAFLMVRAAPDRPAGNRCADAPCPP